MIVLLWLTACTAPSDSGMSDSADSADSEVPEVAFAQPAAGVDLDPAPGVLHVALVADEADLDVGGAVRAAFAYDGQVPGPTLRARAGDVLRVDLDNRLDVPTTIHWHGVHVPWAMDGVTWMQDPVQPGQTFTYTFPLTRAGTFWYHPHFDTDRQVDLGLYGMLVVEDPADPSPDADWVWVLDTWSEHDGLDHGIGWQADGWTVNGLAEPVARVAGGTTVRVRVLNASNEGYVALAAPGMRHIGSEQGLRPAPTEPARIVLAPGERTDLELRIGEDAFDVVTEPYSAAGDGADPASAARLLRVVPDAPAPAPAPLDWPFPAGTPSPDPTWTDIVYTFQGDPGTGVWMINGEQFPDVTVEQVALGAVAVIEVRNVSPTRHPFHLHGMPFEVLSVDGVAPELQTIEDTVDVGIGERVRLRLIADNPGDWMAHCHILPHADSGMMTVLRVAESR